MVPACGLRRDTIPARVRRAAEQIIPLAQVGRFIPSHQVLPARAGHAVVHDKTVTTTPDKALEELVAGGQFAFLVHHAFGPPMHAVGRGGQQAVPGLQAVAALFGVHHERVELTVVPHDGRVPHGALLGTVNHGAKIGAKAEAENRQSGKRRWVYARRVRPELGVSFIHGCHILACRGVVCLRRCSSAPAPSRYRRRICHVRRCRRCLGAAAVRSRPRPVGASCGRPARPYDTTHLKVRTPNVHRLPTSLA